MSKAVIKKYQRKLEKSVKENDQSVLAKAYVKLLDVARPLYFTEEFLLLNGLKGKVESDQKSILFFSVHKAASTFIKNTVIELVKNKTLLTVNFSGYLSKKKQEEYYNDPRIMKKVLKPKGYFYGAFRSFYNFPDLDKFKTLLVLRDPRDVLTSYYFSTLYNHPLGRKEVFEEREKHANATIDEFVLEKAPEFKKKYQDYCQHLLGKENVLLLKYEEMITEFGSWLQKLSTFLGLKDNKEALDAIVAKTSFKVKKEDPNSFIRNIKAKDHKDKLKPETIAKLTALFKDELLQLDYDLE
jgi:hypothetical protein